MSNNLFRQVIKAEGYCCPWAFLVTHRDEKGKDLAERYLGIHRVTLGRWRKKLRLGELSCECSSKCLRETCKNPQPISLKVHTFD